MQIVNAVGRYLGSGRWFKRNVANIQWITVHHTASLATGSDDQVMKNEMNHHLNNGWAGLAYHYFITKNGNIYQINNLEDHTYHDAVNWDSVGVVLAGYFHPPHNEKPTDAQLKALRFLLDHLSTEHPEFPADQSKVVPHKMRSATACCGDNLVPLVNDYRNRLGDVPWGDYGNTDSPPTTGYSQEQVNKMIAEAVDKVKREFEVKIADIRKECQSTLQDYKDKVAKKADEIKNL